MEINKYHQAILDYFKHYIEDDNAGNMIYQGRRWHKASIGKIADSSLYTDRAVRKYLDELIDHGFIEKKFLIEKGDTKTYKRFAHRVFHYAFADSSNLL